MNKMKPFDKGVVIFTLVSFTGLLVLCTYAYLEAQKSIGGIKKAVTIVSTATHKTTAEIARILQESNGVFQKIEHNVGDLISVLRTDSENGIYEVTQKFTLLQTNLNNAIVTVQNGVYKDSNLVSNSILSMHRVLSAAAYMPHVVPRYIVRDIVNFAFVPNQYITFTVNSFTSARAHWNFTPKTDPNDHITDERIFIQKSDVQFLGKIINITSGWTEEDNLSGATGNLWQWRLRTDQIIDLMNKKSISTTIEWEPIDED